MQVLIFKPVSSSDFEMDCKFRISNRFHRPIFKPISKKGGMNKITMINAKITFKKYVFARVKNISGASAVAYTDTTWVGKTVSIIPMKLNVTDRYIETCYNEETGQYELEAETDVIFKKTVNKGKNIGRLHFPKELVGLDVLIIEAPQIENLY